MKKTLSYRVPLVSNCGFDADFENCIDKIRISNVNIKGNYYNNGAEAMRTNILYNYVPMYSNLNPSLKEHRKDLAKVLREDIAKLEGRINELTLVVQICSKNKITL